MKDLVSIIVPIYNTEKYLKKCINSIIDQTHQNIEIILIDDGSLDNSPKICDEYAKKDSRIKVIHKANTGVSDARKIGINASKGDFIMFVDGDDWINRDTCKIALDSINKYDCEVVMFPYIREFSNVSLKKEIFDENKIFLADKYNYIYRFLFGPIKEELRRPENADTLAPCCMKLYKSELLRENNIWYEDTKKVGSYEDGLLNISIFNKVKSAVFIDKYLYHYRKTNSGSITSKYRDKLLEQWTTLFKLMDQYINEHNLDEEFREALSNRIALSILVLSMNLHRSDMSMFYKIKEIKKIINMPMYKKSYKQLTLKYFPIHWKLFYGCAKYNFSIGVYFFSSVIIKFIGKK